MHDGPAPPARARPVPRDEEVTRVVRCPFCRAADSRVVDSREADEGSAIRRRRACQACGQRFTTVEAPSLLVIKRSGVTEPFRRDKVLAGVRKACQGRPVTEDALAALAQRVEQDVRARGVAGIASDDVGRAILTPLHDLDEVAYLRFASVYRAFEFLADFEAEIALLRLEREPGPPADDRHEPEVHDLGPPAGAAVPAPPPTGARASGGAPAP